MRQAFASWIEYRYGQGASRRPALKPPLGWHPEFSPRSCWWRLGYLLRLVLWRIESAGFERLRDPRPFNWAAFLDVILLLSALAVVFTHCRR